MQTPEIAASGGSVRNDVVEAPSSTHAPSDEAIPTATAAVPAAEPVERGRFVLHLHDRDEDSVVSERDGADGNDNDNDNDNDNKADAIAPDSPKSFNSEELFDDVDVEAHTAPGGEERISDKDLERLLGPLPLRRTTNTGKDGKPSHGPLEVDDGEEESGSDASRRKKKPRRGLCLCCPDAVRRGPWRALSAITGNDGSVPSTRVGNMIVILPRCFYERGFGIMGPHWFGPICCLGILTGATTYFARKAHRDIGPISAMTCLLFYTTAVVSLCVVSCSDPGVVRSGDGGPPDARGGGKDGYAGLPTTNVSAGRGWRYCDLCSLYQPPDAVHCPECNVCIEGYDHHCPWMGTCIGKKNFTSFMAFNITWLFYLMYSIIWVAILGTSFANVSVDSSADRSIWDGDF